MQVNGPDAAEQERRRLVSRVAELEALVYVPGLWRCAKCKFQLVQAVISASTGTVHSHDKPGEKCPNCSGPLWRVTERQAGNDMADRCEAEVMRSRALEAALRDLIAWRAEPWVARGINVVGIRLFLGSIRDEDIDAARQRTAAVWESADTALKL